MPWVKLSDDWYDDPDIIRAGADGGWLWVVALSWSARNLTDGRVPATLLTRLVDLPDVPALVDRLVGLGLVEVKGEDVVVANYHKYQPTRADVLARREADSERKARGRRNKSERIPDGIHAESARPGPGPVPVPISSSSSVLPVDKEPVDNDVHAVAVEIARLRSRAPGANVRSFDRWAPTVIAKLVEDPEGHIRDAVSRYDENPVRLAEMLEGKRPSRGLRLRHPEGIDSVVDAIPGAAAAARAALQGAS